MSRPLCLCCCWGSLGIWYCSTAFVTLRITRIQVAILHPRRSELRPRLSTPFTLSRNTSSAYYCELWRGPSSAFLRKLWARQHLEMPGRPNLQACIFNKGDASSAKCLLLALASTELALVIDLKVENIFIRNLLSSKRKKSKRLSVTSRRKKWGFPLPVGDNQYRPGITLVFKAPYFKHLARVGRLGISTGRLTPRP